MNQKTNKLDKSRKEKDISMIKQKIRIEDHDGIGRIFIDDVELQNVMGYEIKRCASETTHLLIRIVTNEKDLDLNFSANNICNDLSGNV